METLGIDGLGANIEFLKPFGFPDYIKMQMNAYCVVSDSGTITEESSILGFPAIMIRQTHERPEGMDEGTLIMAGLMKDSVLNAIGVITAQAQDCPRGFRVVPDYTLENVSKKVVRIIVSYIDYINRTVWSKGL
jgi:UDP-N-acetylglucosamine 2-epimerase (non-hydrolysing)